MKPFKSNIKVSIICNTFNQEYYIEEALESFLNQKTNFLYEILIHDDASTDGTTDIVRKYSSKYPDIIKPIFQNSNKYSKEISIIDNYQYPRVKGEYIAFCEGDDYWIDRYKLQKQVDFLDCCQSIDICSHAANIVDSKNRRVLGKISPNNQDKIFSLEEVILGGGGFVATNSLMYRSSLISNLPSFRQYMDLDYAIQINGSLRGGMGYLSDTMSAYRVASKESWTMRMAQNSNEHIYLLLKIITMLNILDNDTNRIHHNIIEKAIFEQEMQIIEIDKEYKYKFQNNHKKYIKHLGNIRYLKFLIKVYLPFVYRMYINFLYK